ncbi:prepilin-type N-terminal cleavage/methylation domain-containing protein [Sporolactobacillus sp. Y61]|jgi:type IV pilus assembly protein PilA|uniref:Prepilin-type N-terminal cleavage/methylation domain-containing protein n=1 Tax=Sporolactobacillus sp. Y61 TaxID=3160863 RepID=A0AAU8IF15_9BACL
MLKKLRAKSKDQKGFTLVELLAVIVILAIIAAIAVPIITNVISGQREKANYQDALNIIHAAKLYNAENPDDNSLTYDDLKKYLGHARDTSFTVSVTDGEYSITGHAGVTDGSTEQEIVAKSGEEEPESTTE